MRRTISWALFALLLMSATAFPQRFLHRHVVHVRPVVPITRFYGWCPPWLAHPYPPFQYFYPVPYPVASPLPDYTLPTPNYVFVGSATTTYPQLVFKDGTRYTVADYWREDDELHFTTVEEGGTKFVPHSVPFDDLDLDATKDRAAVEGFRFLIRDKPIEQWLEDRAQKRSQRHKEAGER